MKGAGLLFMGAIVSWDYICGQENSKVVVLQEDTAMTYLLSRRPQQILAIL